MFAQFQRTNFWPQNDPFFFTVPTRRAKSTPVFFSLATKPLPLDSFNKRRIFYVLYTGNLLSQQQDRETRFNRFSWISTQIRLQELKVETTESTTGFHLSPPRNADPSVFLSIVQQDFSFQSLITINSFFLYDHGSATTVYIITTSSRLSQRCNERTRGGKSSIVESWIGWTEERWKYSRIINRITKQLNQRLIYLKHSSRIEYRATHLTTHFWRDSITNRSGEHRTSGDRSAIRMPWILYTRRPPPPWNQMIIYICICICISGTKSTATWNKDTSRWPGMRATHDTEFSLGREGSQKPLEAKRILIWNNMHTNTHVTHVKAQRKEGEK